MRDLEEAPQLHRGGQSPQLRRPVQVEVDAGSPVGPGQEEMALEGQLVGDEEKGFEGQLCLVEAGRRGCV